VAPRSINLSPLGERFNFYHMEVNREYLIQGMARKGRAANIKIDKNKENAFLIIKMENYS